MKIVMNSLLIIIKNKLLWEKEKIYHKFYIVNLILFIKKRKKGIIFY